MNCQNRFVFETAKLSDAKEILDIIEETDYQGMISLLNTRRPDPIKSYFTESNEVYICVCRDMLINKIIGLGICSVYNLYVNGKKERVGYLHSLRLKSEYTKKFKIFIKAYDYLHSILKDKNIKYFYNTVLEDNKYYQNLIQKKSKLIPQHKFVGDYEVYILGTKYKKTDDSYNLRKIEQHDMTNLNNFIKENSKNLAFFPALKIENLSDKIIGDLKTSDIYGLFDDENILVAIASTWNQKDYKQYIVKGYGGILKYLQPFMKFISILGYPELPKLNNAVNYFTLSFFLVKDNEPHIFDILINKIKQITYKEYKLFVVGIHEKNEISTILSKQKHIKYKSKLYLISWDEQDKCEISDSILYLECGLL